MQSNHFLIILFFQFQYKEKIVRLEKLYEEEKKKSEDLQFSLDEAEAQTEENEVIIKF